MNEGQNREEIIFEAVLRLATAAERAAYLNEACAGDAVLRQRIESLLEAHEQTANALDHPPVSGAKTIVISAAMMPVTEQPGQTIGRYKLREKIGEGGCGVVYVADQEEPVRRRVALKIVKLGMDTRQVIARFEAERQVLALMDHPNIAKVLDGGATATGRPYFVMELVRGIKITDYCDKNNLSTTERLKLFIQVCQAVQHAHQKGIIHRDIKPSNVLVTLHDGVPVPKVIDFGIAKATNDQRLTDKTIYTAFEQFIGTPAYMSPEQAEMSGLDIDTRSDIYSLGVLLYELLTGRTPFDPTTLLNAGLDQMRRIIREQEPARPSTCLSTLTEADLTLVAGHRGVEPPKLRHAIAGDLDWIVMKLLEKDRTRRYDTATGVAADIQRHLDNEPVVARPPSQIYRFRKMVRRNKWAFISVTGMVLLVIIGLSFSTWLLQREKTNLQRMLAAERMKNQLKQELDVSQSMREAEGHLNSLRVIMNFGQENGSETLEDIKFSEACVKSEFLLRSALAACELTEGTNSQILLSSLTNLSFVLHAHVKTKKNDAEIEQLERRILAIKINLFGREGPELKDDLSQLATDLITAGEMEKAEKVYRDLLAVARKHPGEENDDLLRAMVGLAKALSSENKLAESEAFYREAWAQRKAANMVTEENVPVFVGGITAVKLKKQLADVLYREGKLEESEKIYRDVIALLDEAYYKRANNFEQDPATGWNMGTNKEVGQVPDFFHFEGYAFTIRNLAKVLEAEGKSLESELALKKARDFEKKLLELNASGATSMDLAPYYYDHDLGVEAENLFKEILLNNTNQIINKKLLVSRAGLRQDFGHFKEAAQDIVAAFGTNLNGVDEKKLYPSDLALAALDKGDLTEYCRYLGMVSISSNEVVNIQDATYYKAIPNMYAYLARPISGTNLAIINAFADNLVKRIDYEHGYLFVTIPNQYGVFKDWQTNFVGMASGYFIFKALAEYRLGDFTAAIHFSEMSLGLHEAPLNYAVLALAQFKLGKVREAKESFLKGDDLDQGRNLVAHILLREARLLILPTSAH